MSHFSVLVIGDNVEKQLAPYHEFESTGLDNEFVVDMDRTAEAFAEFEKATVIRLKAPNGTLHDPFNARGDYVSRFSKLDSDGRRALYLPPGFTKVTVPAKDHEEAAEWIGGYFGWKSLIEGQKLTEEHRYGYIVMGTDGKVLRCIDRTNPNKKWDWWAVGGRWSGHLQLRNGRKVDTARKGEVDFARMRSERGSKAGKKWDEVHAIVAGREIPHWDALLAGFGKERVEEARKVYHSNEVVVAVRKGIDPFIDVEDYDMPREQYVAQEAANACLTFAVIKDGKWYERGRMGWFAFVADEKSDEVWRTEFNKLLDELPAATMLTVVDCHI